MTSLIWKGLEGTHTLPLESSVWLVQEDAHGRLFLHSGPLRLLQTVWRPKSVSLRGSDIYAVQVTPQGANEFDNSLRDGREAGFTSLPNGSRIIKERKVRVYEEGTSRATGGGDADPFWYEYPDEIRGVVRGSGIVCYLVGAIALIGFLIRPESTRPVLPDMRGGLYARLWLPLTLVGCTPARRRAPTAGTQQRRA